MKTKTYTNDIGTKFIVKSSVSFPDDTIQSIIRHRMEDEPEITVGHTIVIVGSNIVKDGTPFVKCIASTAKAKTYKGLLGSYKGKTFTVSGNF